MSKRNIIILIAILAVLVALIVIIVILLLPANKADAVNKVAQTVEPTPTVKPTAEPTVAPQIDSIDNYENRIEYLFVNDAKLMDEFDSIGVEEQVISKGIQIALTSNDLAKLPDLCKRGVANAMRVYEVIPVTEIGKEFSEMFTERWALGILVYNALEEGDMETAVDYSADIIALRDEERQWLLTK